MPNNRKILKDTRNTRPPNRNPSRSHSARLNANPHSLTIFRSPTFVPDTMRRTLRYVQEIALVGAAGAIGFGTLNLNGPYLPTTVGAHQPMGWDQYIAMYRNACVLSCRVTADFTQNGATVPTIIGITGSTSTTLWSTGTGRVESGLTPYRVMPSACTVPMSLSAFYDIAKLSGVTDLADEPDYWCSDAANPTNTTIGQVWARDVNGTSSINLTAFTVMEFDILFLKPATIVQS